MSPSTTPARTPVSRRCRRVCTSSVVLPAPGEDIRFTQRTPAASSRARFSAAARSFSPKMRSRTITRSTPVSYAERSPCSSLTADPGWSS